MLKRGLALTLASCGGTSAARTEPLESLSQITDNVAFIRKTRNIADPPAVSDFPFHYARWSMNV